MKTLEVLLVGAGAVGANLAEQLLTAKHARCRFCAATPRAEKINAEGIFVNDLRLNIECVEPGKIAEDIDLIILCVKAGHLTQTLEDIAPAVSERTQILSLLNGVESEEAIAAIYGWERTLYGYVVGIDAMRHENRIGVDTRGTYYFGRKENHTTCSEVQVVRELFECSGVNYQIPEDMKHSLWWKFMINVGINPVSAILRASYGLFQKKGQAWNLMAESIEEVRALATKEEIELSEADVQKWFSILETLDAAGETSMLQDVKAGRKTEVAIFCDTALGLGRKHGVPTPLNEVMSRMLHAIDEGVS